MRILLIHPNTTESVTALVASHARAIAGGAATFVPVTGGFGANYISTRASAAIAAHAALDALAQHVAGCDAVYLAQAGHCGTSISDASPGASFPRSLAENNSPTILIPCGYCARPSSLMPALSQPGGVHAGHE